MSKRFHLVAGLALAVLAASPSMARAQAQRNVTVEYSHARLSQVVRAFATFADRTIIVPSNVEDLDVTAAFSNVDWRTALDAILQEHGLVLRADASGVLRVEKQKPGERRANSDH